MNQNGFTLFEIIIALIIVAVLTAIAIPTYQSQITKARRNDGKLALLNLAQRMETYYLQQQSYQGATLGENSETDVLPSDKSSKKFYQLKIITQSDSEFLLAAVPLNSQAKHDKTCGSFQINHLGEKSITGNGKLGECW